MGMLKIVETIKAHSGGQRDLIDRIESSDDKCATFLDCLADEDVPRAWYCFLEDHLKTQTPNGEKVFQGK